MADRWLTTRQSLREGDTEIEFVPGAESGQRAYFWIGVRGKYVAHIDARKLARLIDKARPLDRELVE